MSNPIKPCSHTELMNRQKEVAEDAIQQIRAWNTDYNRKTIAVDHPRIRLELERAFILGVRWAKEKF